MPVNSFDDYPMSWKPCLQTDGEVPIYIYLADLLQADILGGKLTPGTKLPPQRELADYLDINLSTVTRAFKLCEQRGFICSAVGRGTYVSSDAAAQSIMLLHHPKDKIIEMGAILPNPDINEIASDYLRKMASEPDFYKLLQYGMIDYDELQIKAAVQWLAYSGIRSERKHIIFSCGSQNGIFAALASLFQKGEKVAVMPVTYPGLKSAAKILGIQAVAIPLHEGKVTEESLEYVYRNHNIKGFYFVPDFNNPTSEMMDLDTRKRIAHFCSSHNLPVIEDGIYTLFLPDPLPPISSFAPEQGIFISSVSKILSPGLRIAVIHAPDRYRRRIWECLYSMQIAPPALMMQLFTRLVIAGQFDEIRRQRIQELEERNTIFDRMCPEFHSIGDRYSPIRWLFLPENGGMTPATFEKSAYAHGVQVYGAERFTVGNGAIPRAVRISLISARPTEKYEEGLEILRKLFAAASGKKTVQMDQVFG